MIWLTIHIQQNKVSSIYNVVIVSSQFSQMFVYIEDVISIPSITNIICLPFIQVIYFSINVKI